MHWWCLSVPPSIWHILNICLNIKNCKLYPLYKVLLSNYVEFGDLDLLPWLPINPCTPKVWDLCSFQTLLETSIGLASFKVLTDWKIAKLEKCLLTFCWQCLRLWPFVQISQHWLTQCFWNYLDWVDICHYLIICLILGVDYQVYMCVAILKHLQKDINSHMKTQDLIMFLKVSSIYTG